MFLILITGFIASTVHVLTGPDHLAAVVPLAINSKNRSWIIGFSWGLGHVAGMFMIGLLFILFRNLLPIDAISRNSEPIVGILLILVGIWAISRIAVIRRDQFSSRLHFHFKPSPYLHKHEHTRENTHDHEHEHHHESSHSILNNGLSACSIGIVHGVAGISHLVALLPSLALPGTASTVIYLGGFSAGTILTMMLFALPLGVLAQKLAVRRQNRILNMVTLSGGSLAIATGLIWIGIAII